MQCSILDWILEQRENINENVVKLNEVQGLVNSNVPILVS